MTVNSPESWEKVRNCDADAWKNLVSRYSPLVYSVARRAGLTSYDAEDCAQITWITLYRNRRKIRDPQKLPAWLIKTTHRHAMRMMRNHYRNRIDITADSEKPSPIIPEEELLKIERFDALIHALEQMDERCRKILSSLFLSPKELTYESIAKSVGIAPNSLGPIRGRCLKRLREIMKNMGY